MAAPRAFLTGRCVKRLAACVLIAVALAACQRGAPHVAGPAAVDRARLLAADAEPGQWLANGRDWRGGYYSPLTQIDVKTAPRLGFAWAYDLGTARGLEATPVVVDGVMYTSGDWGRVYALDAKTGRELWSFIPDVDGQYGRYACCDVVNRGVAVWKGRVYVGALDGWLYALDARTGRVVWKADTFIERARKHPATITGAPQVAGDVVVIGQGGADFADGRGYVTAYDLATGKQRWRFFTVPGDPKKPFEHPEMAVASKTWSPNSLWSSGGGGTAWDAMAYDPTLDLLYVGTGNASPFAWKDRSPGGGDNLYLASILAIHPSTGRLAWHYQEVPGERWDYTATQKMILADLKIGGRTRQVLMQAPKDGFFYVLDRRSGELISAKPYASVNWASGIDLKTGRPMFNPAADYEKGPALVYPSSAGGHNWQPMAFNPKTGLVYIPVIEGAMIFAKGYDLRGRTLADRWNVNGVFADDYPPAGFPELGLPSLATVLGGRTFPTRRGVLRAWDPVAGRAVWETPSPSFWDGGVLSTAGDLVIQGDITGALVVRDAHSGAVIKRIDTGSSIMAAPMTYAVGGVQYVAVMAGFGGGPGWAYPPDSAAYRYGNAGRILAFRLDGGATPKPQPFVEQPLPPPPVAMGSAAEIAEGGRLFSAQCSRCHANVARGLVPDLRRMSAQTHKDFADIVLRGQRIPAGMGRFDDVLGDADVRHIHGYLIDQARLAYAAQQKGTKAGGARQPQKAN
jgi:quinohemoprotein ethanol dehydrogenase